MAEAAQADDAAIKALVKSMSDYLAAQKSISFDMETDLEIVTTEGQRLSLASSGAIELSRPDKIRAERKGGFADVEAVYDGKTLSLLGKNLNLYTQIPIAATRPPRRRAARQVRPAAAGRRSPHKRSLQADHDRREGREVPRPGRHPRADVRTRRHAHR